MQTNRLDAFKGKTQKIDISEQLEILISSEDDPDKRWGLYESWQRARKKKDFDELTFLDGIIANPSQYLD